MTKFILLPLAFLCFGLATTVSQAGTPTPQEAARAAAEPWLALVDAGKSAESWQKLDPAFAKRVGKKKWVASIAEIRGRTGKLVSRKFDSAEYTKELPGAPEGEYVVLEFETVFAQKDAASEKVTLILGRDLNWRVAGYAVK